jgi:hypothetical protein
LEIIRQKNLENESIDPSAEIYYNMNIGIGMFQSNLAIGEVCLGRKL